MKYRIIDKYERNAEQELKEYSFAELKAKFEPDKSECKEYWEKWNKIEDLTDLKNYLILEDGYSASAYVFEKIEE